jgi:cation diffusion facilitator CzcD-associated flavoprotein CzcO
MPDDVLIVGAGPYGLAAAAQLRRAGVAARVLGDPMAFWRSMPAGMRLRSNRSATSMVDREGPLSLTAFETDTGLDVSAPLALERFVAYGEWVQRRAVPDVDRRRVTRIERADGAFRVTLEDGERLAAPRVVVAAGIAPFARRPPQFAPLYPDLASHTGDHADPAEFAGRRVAVLGGGQSALEYTALMHAAGVDVEVFVRADRVIWLRAVSVHRRLGRLGPVVYAPTDVGPLWYSRLNAVPDAFRRLPRRAQERIAARSIRPACSHWVRERLEDVPIRLATPVASAERRGGRVALRLGDGSRKEFDHLLLGTGYRVDVARYGFLAPELLAGLRTAGGFPVLVGGMESSVAGLHFLGAPAAWSFGPTMRFVSGTWYGAGAVARAITRGRGADPVPVSAPARAGVVL